MECEIPLSCAYVWHVTTHVYKKLLLWRWWILYRVVGHPFIASISAVARIRLLWNQKSYLCAMILIFVIVQSDRPPIVFTSAKHQNCINCIMNDYRDYHCTDHQPEICQSWSLCKRKYCIIREKVVESKFYNTGRKGRKNIGNSWVPRERKIL